MDLWHRILKWVDYNRGLVVAMLMVLVTMFWLYGCQSTTSSVLNPGSRIDRAGLDREGALITAEYKQRMEQVALGYDDLDSQDEMRKQIIEAVGSFATAAAQGSVNPVQAVVGGISLLSAVGFAGTLYDNRRKDKKIKESA